ncbi:hypothetical protein CDD80_758 [Ophiocordyceps camponoti-rufipedis]|uniref:Uncharacterized protein n=1 Tax=Ophiocordyceps camponoti-rufipedis TaxID=2004952 RepID=A0A2C5ZB82_9HYPO|nr:hypothetical protein CDD80_758 [Ophiocordyceps camponoti-rufipedis]
MKFSPVVIFAVLAAAQESQAPAATTSTGVAGDLQNVLDKAKTFLGGNAATTGDGVPRVVGAPGEATLSTPATGGVVPTTTRAPDARIDTSSSRLAIDSSSKPTPASSSSSSSLTTKASSSSSSTTSKTSSASKSGTPTKSGKSASETSSGAAAGERAPGSLFAVGAGAAALLMAL